MAEWRLNPKSHTAQDQVRREKKEAAEKAKQEKAENKRGKKRSANEAFMGEDDEKTQQLEDGMTLISDLTEAPTFLVGLVGDESTRSALSAL